MAIKDIRFETFLASTDRHITMKRPLVYTNDKNSVRLIFDVKDMADSELSGASAEVLLYMRDGSFYQVTDVTRNGTEFSYVLKDNEGKHSGTARVQLIVTVGQRELATPKFEFVIESGLDGKVATEVMIQDWTTLTREARELLVEIEGNEDIRIAAENTRKESENTRQSNETERISAESERLSAEDERKEFYDGFSGRINAHETKIATNQRTIRTVEDTLSNVNVNQEATQTISTDAQIASLPVNAGNGTLDATLKGFTATQLVTNGDFSDGTNGFLADINGTITSENKILKLTALGTSSQSRVKVNDKIRNLTDRFYTRVVARVTNSECKSIMCHDGYSIASGIVRNPIQNQWYNISVTNTVNYNSRDLYVYQNYVDAATSLDKVMEIKEVSTINLTQTFGAGNEPTKAQCDVIFDTYFNGTKSFTPGRVKSVGKNLFDKHKWEQGTYQTIAGATQGNLLASSTRIRGIFPVKPLTTYIRTDGALYFRSQGYFDKNMRFLEVGNTMGNTPFTTPENAYFIIVVYSLNSGGTSLIQPLNAMEDTGLQLEPGSTATPYEPYTETTQYVEPVKLNRLPNGVADEITADGDFIQRVGETALIRNNITSYSPLTNVDIVVLNNIEGSVIYNNSGLAVMTTISSPKIPSATVDSVTSIGMHYQNPGNWAIIVPKGQYSGVGASRDDLAGTKIWYQLAEPIVHKNVTSGHLIAHPKGTVYFEQYQADAGVYAGGITTTRTTHSIKSLESLSVVDFMTGDEVTLDISKATIDGNTITHPDLSDGDLVFFTYEFSAPGPNGEKTLSFYDSRYTIKDEATGQFYKWKVSVANGVPKLEVEGV